MAGVSPDVLRPLFEDALEMLSLAWRSFQRHDPAGLDRAERLGRTIHKREKELTEGLLASPPDSGTPPFVPGHFERIGNAAEGLVRCLRGMEDESATFTEGGTREVNELFERAIELTQCAGDLVLTGNRVLARHIEIESMRFEDQAAGFVRAHERRLIDGVCSPRASSAYLAMLDDLLEIVRHARRIASRVTPRSALTRPSIG
ncbi:MAG: hypothetical protein ABW020_02260 [Candidatus Rokuibacteriota bacterium]